MDDAKVEAFTDELVGILNHGALATMISIGHRTGLFDKLAELDAVTSDELADQAVLNERYVREWLNAMLVGGIVSYDPESKRYALPAEHAAALTRAAAPNNIAAFMQYVPLLGSVEDLIIECFEKGGGVPYEKFPRFHEVMAEDSGQTVLPALLDSILPLVPGLVERLETGIDVLDVGCGSGRALNLMAAHFPKSRFKGYDFSEEAITTAQAEVDAKRLGNVRFEVKDVTDLGMTDSFDLITTFDAVHDQARPDLVLKGICEALRPDGVYLMQDIKGSSYPEKNVDHPLASFLYTVSCMHCMTVSLAAGGMGLGTMWGREKARAMLRDAGFSQIEIKELAHDPQNDYYVIRKE